jgi:anthocyanidin 3-O-glucosyltransferase
VRWNIDIANRACPSATAMASPLVVAAAAAAPSATFSFLSIQDSLARLGDSAVPSNMNPVEVLWAEWDKTKTPVPRRIELFLDGAVDGGLRQAIVMAASTAGGARVSCVVGDAFMSMAAEAGVPWAAVWTGSPCALLAHIMGDAIREGTGNDGIYVFIRN